MRPQEDKELEQRLRAAFEPDAPAVNRVVAAAMRSRSRRPMVARVAAAFALAGVVLVLLFLSLQPSQIRAESLRLEYVGGVALLEFPDGSCWLVTADVDSHGSRTHPNLIIVEGEKP